MCGVYGMNIYQPSFFDEADRLAKLSKLKDPLEALKQHVDFEVFRPQLEAVFNTSYDLQ